MGICWSVSLPEEDDKHTTPSSQIPLPDKALRNNVEFGKEEVKLNELLASLRTGLVFAPTEFSVLPGKIATTAQVRFTIGNSDLQRRIQANYLKEKEESKSPHHDASDKNEQESEQKEEEDALKLSSEPYKLKVALEGHGWTKGLIMILKIQPVFGKFAGKKLEFHWREDNLEVLGCQKGELEARSLPVSFENEEDFCKCCLLLTYQSVNKSTSLQMDDNEGDENNTLEDSEPRVKSLTSYAYSVAVANLDTIRNNINTIPAKLYHIFFGSQDPVSISITLWPKTCVTDANLEMKVKSGILFAEFMYLVKEHLQINPCNSLKLYSKYRPVYMSEIVSTECKALDCFVVARNDSYDNSEEEELLSTKVNLVVSLVGEKIQDMEVDLEMSMRKFDVLVREKFALQKDSFLVILAEDDYSPQYTADDNWKCTYPFSIPNSSFRDGLRRSFRKFSTRRQGERSHTQGSENDVATFAPLMAEVIELLSSEERRFPRNSQKCGLSIEELYESMPLYRTSVEGCGIHPFSIVQVFEVTGPSIPITVRVLSDYSQDNTPLHQNSRTARTRLANIMDINPEWSVNTFLQYIDAVVSLSSSARHKKLLLKENSVESRKDDLSNLKLGDLLDNWKPLWWAEAGCKRKQLTTKDIDPSEYLIVEKL